MISLQGSYALRCFGYLRCIGTRSYLKYWLLYLDNIFFHYKRHLKKKVDAKISKSLKNISKIWKIKKYIIVYIVVFNFLNHSSNLHTQKRKGRTYFFLHFMSFFYPINQRICQFLKIYSGKCYGGEIEYSFYTFFIILSYI